jgi:recombination protein RecA
MATKKKIGVLLAEKDLKRRYPDSGLASNICLPGDKSLRLPCEVVTINHHLGGGIPYGKIVENFGEESTGKTLLAKNFSKVAQAMGGIVLWIDSECTFDPDWAQAHGLDLSKIQLLPMENRMEIISDWIADYCIYWRSKLVNNEPILLVWDSIAVAEGKDVMEVAEVDTKAEMGRRSFLMGKLLRKRTRIFAKYGICVYFINQLRVKVGASQFEDPDTSPLSQCMKYYAAQRFGLYRGKRLKDTKKGKKWVGNLVYVRTKKNKTSAPKDNVQAHVYFREDEGNFGYHKYHGLEELLVEAGIVKRANGKFSYKGEFIAKGEEAFLKAIANNQELRKKLLNKLGVNTPSKLRSRLEELRESKTNLYPVKLKTQSESSDEE